MKKLFTGLFVICVMMSAFSAAEACSKNCPCGCNKGSACTCIKDDKGNIFRADIISNFNTKKKTAEKCARKSKCSDGSTCSKVKKCGLFKKKNCSEKTKTNKLLFWKKNTSAAE